ncbi:MAG TPA: RHS repeat-associated core domain-containing protein, partial [Cytophagaceae bacterium]
FMSNIDYKLVIKDQPIYGQTKAGFYNNENTVYSTNGSTTNTSFQKSKLSFELTDHLGNVRALVSGVKKSSGMADVQSLKDYYPFGMPMYSDAVTERSRVFNSPTSSRYEFNGKEEDAETNSYDFGARAYDSRVGRWWSVEPLSYRYPGLSSYAFVANNPVNAIDPDGRKIIFVNGYWARGIIGWVFGSKQPGKEYWGDNFEKAAAKFFGDNSGFNEWVDASSTFGGDMSGDERYAAGYIYAMDNYDALIDNMTADEVFNIVTHSEGAAHGAGMAQYLIEKGHTVKTVVHLSADEGDEFTTPDEPETYQMAYEGDWVTGNKKITGSDRYEVINRPDLGWQHVHGTTKSASVFGYVTTMRNQANTIKLKTKETNSSGSRSNKGGKKSTDTNYSKIDSSGKVKKK